MIEVLVDTSVWISHLRDDEARLNELLFEDQVVCHPFVIGELACGNLKHRREFLSLLTELPQTPELSHDEVLDFIDGYRLMGRGLGWVDVHLLASARLAETPLWSHDKALRAVASEMGVLYLP